MLNTSITRLFSLTKHIVTFDLIIIKHTDEASSNVIVGVDPVIVVGVDPVVVFAVGGADPMKSL